VHDSEPLLHEYVAEVSSFRDDQTVPLLADALRPFHAPRDWTQPERDTVTFILRVLSALAAVEPLADFMAAVDDSLLAVECGHALCDTRRAGAHAPLLAARDRFGINSQVWMQIARLFARVPAPQGESEPATAQEFIDRGNAHYNKGDFDAAIEAFSRAIALDPRNRYAYNNRGISRRNKGEFDAAIEDFSHAITLNPKDAHAYNNRGNAHRNKGELDAAIQDFSRAIALDAKSAAPYSNRGSARRSKGDLDAAIQDFSRAIALEPNDASAHNNRGNAHRIKGDLDAAIRDFSRSIALDSRSALTYNNRANAHRDRGDLDAAIEDWEQFLRLAPKGWNRSRFPAHSGLLPFAACRAPISRGSRCRRDAMRT
jgi:tetratricopeptide (TPR) repeat protein